MVTPAQQSQTLNSPSQTRQSHRSEWPGPWWGSRAGPTCGGWRTSGHWEWLDWCCSSQPSTPCPANISSPGGTFLINIHFDFTFLHLIGGVILTVSSYLPFLHTFRILSLLRHIPGISRYCPLLYEHLEQATRRNIFVLYSRHVPLDWFREAFSVTILSSATQY